MTDGVHAASGPLGLHGEVEVGAWAARPDAHLVLVEQGAVRAHVSLWWRATHERHVGYLGHSGWAGAAAGARLLDAACARLRDEGCRSALGPIDGSTWRSYRVVTDPAPGGAEAPPFASEPVPPPEIGDGFRRAGFAPVARYVSAVVEALPDRAADWSRARHDLAERGVTVRPLDVASLDAELARLYPLITEAFADNPFYTPLSETDFRALYAPLVAQNDPGLMPVAERDAAPVGFFFGFPDFAQAARGEPVDTVICKTLAVAPGARGQGLGGALTLGLEEAARTRGLARAVHALMHEANDSLKISRHGARVMRRYALLGRAL